MAKQSSGMFTINCPCCQGELQVDPETKSVISHKAHEKPRELADIEAAMQRFQGEAGRREDAFQRSVEEHKGHQKVLEKKFDEMFKKVKENPDAPPPRRDIDWD